MKKRTILMLAAFMSVGLFLKADVKTEQNAVNSTKTDKAKVKKPLVQIAILLDTSGSMGGMLKQAQTQLWSIVNQFIKADQNGVVPRVQVALYQYGSPYLGEKSGYIKQLVPLTDDLDAVAAALFKLTDDGGDEYCGHVIQSAAKDLKWSDSDKDYKAIFIAGNEEFSQGDVDYKQACKEAVSKGIIVNTIHCSGGSDEGWAEAAKLADGKFMRIETNQTVVEIDTPYDKELIKLNDDLNDTYIGYGSRGRKMKIRQAANDNYSSSVGTANLSKRIVSKASANYNADSWDIVEATENKKIDIDKMPEEELPEKMQKMSKDERKKYIADLKTKRDAIKKRILELNDKRDKFLLKERKKLVGNKNTLGNQMQKAIEKQAGKKGFNFKK